MELTEGVTHVVMDKTGTLTQGIPTVTNMVINSRWQGHESDLAVLLCAAEEDSIGAHPLASAVFRKLLPIAGDQWKQFHQSGSIRKSEVVPGRGIRCEINPGSAEWKSVVVGSLDFLRESGISGLGHVNDGMLTEGSVVFASINGELAASIVLQVSCRTIHNASADSTLTSASGLCQA